MLADLAGSESSKRSNARYQRLEECKSINLSLSALGNCVAALANVRSNRNRLLWQAVARRLVDVAVTQNENGAP